MFDRAEIDIIIERIEKMELYFDSVKSAVDINPKDVFENKIISEMYYKLIDYYENGQWLKDYEYDERGKLPTDLKRGVLSQDAVYNLLAEINNKA